MPQIFSSISDLVFFGRSRLYILGIMLLEYLSIGIVLFLSAPIEISEPFSGDISIGIFVAFSIILVISLYLFLSYLGAQTYSVRLHSPQAILLSTILYVGISFVLISAFFLVFVYQFTGQLPSNQLEYSIAAFSVVGYANILALSFLAHDFFVGHKISKRRYLSRFFDATKNIKSKPLGDLGTEPADLVESGEKMLHELKRSQLDSTDDLAQDLEEWLHDFDNRDIRGQKKMLGEGLGSDTEFSHWNERFNEFQSIDERLNYLDTSAVYKIGLFVKGISIGASDGTIR